MRDRVDELVEIIRAGIPQNSMREEPHRALDALEELAALVTALRRMALTGCSGKQEHKRTKEVRVEDGIRYFSCGCLQAAT